MANAKIVATLGPATEAPETVRALIRITSLIRQHARRADFVIHIVMRMPMYPERHATARNQSVQFGDECRIERAARMIRRNRARARPVMRHHDRMRWIVPGQFAFQPGEGLCMKLGCILGAQNPALRVVIYDAVIAHNIFRYAHRESSVFF